LEKNMKNSATSSAYLLMCWASNLTK
jgi:hypothetical protein